MSLRGSRWRFERWRTRARASRRFLDEIDAGIGGQTAHAVAEALGRLGGRAQIGRSRTCRRSPARRMRTFESRRCWAIQPTRALLFFQNRAEGRSRTHARWRRVPFDREGNGVSFVEFTGKARLDKRTKRLVHRLGRTTSRSSTRRTSIASPPRSCSRAACAWSSTSHGRRPAVCPPSARWSWCAAASG